jgi:hypothetical protein
MPFIVAPTTLLNSTSTVYSYRGVDMNTQKAKRETVYEETFQYGERNWRDPDWMFETVTHAQALNWLETIESAGAEVIGRWGANFAVNARAWVAKAEAMGQTESIFTGKHLVVMHILMNKISKKVSAEVLQMMKDVT